MFFLLNIGGNVATYLVLLEHVYIVYIYMNIMCVYIVLQIF